MAITISAFESSPDRGQGLARDMGVRWALEEVGQPYKVRLVSFAEMKQPEYLALHPFGQIPTYEENDLVLFESGAIILHVAQRFEGLLPTHIDARARAITWIFAALSTMEPPIIDLSLTNISENNMPWADARRPIVIDRIRVRLAQLSRHLSDKDWLDGVFSAGDLMMVTVLRRLTSSGILSSFPKLVSYIARSEGRPAFQRAFAAQLAIFSSQTKGS